MLQKTPGIVLNFIRYKESSIITKIYTREFGVQSYLVNGVRSKRSRTGMAFFQPLTLLDLVVYHKESKGLKRISELKCLYPYANLQTDYRKVAISAFINELLVKTLKEESGDQDLFQFISTQLVLLDTNDFDPDFPFAFSIGLSRYMGFFPEQATQVLTGRKGVGDEQLISYITAHIENDDLTSLRPGREIRRKALQIITDFFAWHIEGFGKLNSLQILQEVFA